MKTCSVLALIFLFFVNVLQAQNIQQKDVFLLKEVSPQKQSLKGYVSLFHDSLGVLSIQEVSSKSYDSLFVKAKYWKKSEFVNPKSIIWIKLNIQNNTQENRWRIGGLEKNKNIAYFSPDNTYFYIGKSGINYKPSEKYIPYNITSNYSVPIFLTQKQQDVYIKIHSVVSFKTFLKNNRFTAFLDNLYCTLPKKGVVFK